MNFAKKGNTLHKQHCLVSPIYNVGMSQIPSLVRGYWSSMESFYPFNLKMYVFVCDPVILENHIIELSNEISEFRWNKVEQMINMKYL